MWNKSGFFCVEHVCLTLGRFRRIQIFGDVIASTKLKKNFLSYLGGRAKEAGPEEAGRRGAENGGVGDASSCGALMIDRLVGGYHRSREIKAAVVAVVLYQGQRVVLFCRREGGE